MTVFADQLDLRTAVLETVGRTDISDVFTRLTLMAEAAFSRRLRTRDQMTNTVLTMASGTVPLPPDLQEIIGVYSAAGCEYHMRPVQDSHGTGRTYSIDGDNMTSGGLSGDLRVDYYAKIPTITAALTDSNWLLQRYPTIYLYGVAFEAAKYIRDKELAADMLALLKDAYLDAEIDDERTRYSRARIRVQGVTP